MYASLQIFTIMMAIIIPVSFLVFVSSYLNNKKVTKKQLNELRKELKQHSNEDLEKEIAQLKERIVIFESIVTDRHYDLDRKIGNL